MRRSTPLITWLGTLLSAGPLFWLVVTLIRAWADPLTVPERLGFAHGGQVHNLFHRRAVLQHVRGQPRAGRPAVR